jgi:hypothetical protein
MKEIDEAFPRANFEQTLTRLLTMLNYQVDAAKADNERTALATVKGQLEAAKTELEARLLGEESPGVKKEERDGHNKLLKKIMDSFDGESRKTLLCIDLMLAVMHVNIL